MEIGNKEKLSIVDIYNNLYKYGITYLLVILVIIFGLIYVILNKTDITERIITYKIALINGYRVRHEDGYTYLTNKDINIILRYDEKESISNKIKKEKERFYSKDTEESKKTNLQNQSNVLLNLDNMLNPIKQSRLGLPYLGTYYLSFIGKDNIIFKSDVDIHANDIAYSIINTEPPDSRYLDISTNTRKTIKDDVIEQMEATDLKRHRVNWVNISLNTRGIPEKLLEVSHEYSVHTEIFFIDENKGIIYATCKNNEKSISKLNKAVSELKVIALFQKTALV